MLCLLPGDLEWKLEEDYTSYDHIKSDAPLPWTTATPPPVPSGIHRVVMTDTGGWRVLAPFATDLPSKI